jgi:hypothetical protein
MKSAVICGLCVLLGTLIFTATHAIPVNSDRNQHQLMDHLANLKAHAQSPLVRKLLEAVKENTEDVKVAVFVQELLDQSQARGVTDQSAVFGRKEAVAAFAAFQSLPEMAQAQLVFTSIALIAVPIILAIVTALGCCCGLCGGN